MKQLQNNAPHLIQSAVVITAIVILALDHLITGGEAFGGVLAAGGFTLGTVGASASISTAASAAVDVSHSASTPVSPNATHSSNLQSIPQTGTQQGPLN